MAMDAFWLSTMSWLWKSRCGHSKAFPRLAEFGLEQSSILRCRFAAGAASRARELCSQWLVGRSHRVTEQHGSINAL